MLLYFSIYSYMSDNSAETLYVIFTTKDKIEATVAVSVADYVQMIVFRWYVLRYNTYHLTKYETKPDNKVMFL